MKQKWALFVGIYLLIIGIIFRKLYSIDTEALIVIVAGVLLKLYYFVNKVIIGEYKPGFELLFLAFGLTIFFSRSYLHLQINLIPAGLFMGIGILLKVVFIMLFIRKTKAKSKVIKENLPK